MFSRLPFGVDPYSGASGASGANCCNCLPGTTCCACLTRSTLRQSWTMTISGITNGTCSSCSQYNGTFILYWNYDCHWTDWRATPATCVGTTGIVACDPHNTWTLRLETGTFKLRSTAEAGGGLLSVSIYELAEASWNCSGSNVMTRTANVTSSCATGSFPATVTLTPSASVMTLCDCEPAYDAIAARWKVTITGVTALLCNCDTINAEHTLTRDSSACETFDYYCCWGVVIVQPTCTWNTTLRLMFDDANGIVYLFISGRAGLDTRTNYWMPKASFNPVGANVLSKFSACSAFVDEALCQDWPATITIQPA